MSGKRLTWKEVLQSPHQEVVVLSYGYMEKSCVSSHFEPFKTKRSFKFQIDRSVPMLDHRWLHLEDDENDLTFEEKDGQIILDDPDLWARP